MKKLSSLVTVAALTFAIGACSTDPETSDTSAPESATSDEMTQESLTTAITGIVEDTVESTYGVTAEGIEPFAQCIAQDAQSSLSEASLEEVNAGKFPSDPAEESKFSDIMTACSEQDVAPEEDAS